MAHWWLRGTCRAVTAGVAAGIGLAQAGRTTAHADAAGVPCAAEYPIPLLGFGTACLGSDGAATAVAHALAAGYRAIDTALLYGVQEGVGRGIALSPVPRGNIFVTTKVAFYPPGAPPLGLTPGVPALQLCAENQKGREREGIALSLRQLGLDHVDLCLVHTPCTTWLQLWTAYAPHYAGLHGWPTVVAAAMEWVGRTLIWLLEDQKAAREIRLQTWRAMEQLVRDGKCKAIGVSNYEIHHLEELMEYAEIKPVVNQFECHPNFPRTELVDWCQKHGVAAVAYGTQCGARALDGLTMEESAYVPPYPLALRWTLERGIAVLPRADDPRYIDENSRVLAWSLTPEQKAAIRRAASKNAPSYWNPAVVP